MAIVTMIDDTTAAEPYEKDNGKFREKKSLLVISMVLTGISGAMTISSIVSLNRMQNVIDFLVATKRTVPFAMLGFRVVVVMLIVLAFVQLFGNLPMMYAVYKDKVALIFRVQGPFLISSSVLCGAFWLLVLSIFIYEIQMQTAIWLGFAVFVGGFIHAGLIIYFFMTVEAQKHPQTEEEGSAENDGAELDNHYQKF